MFSSFLKELQGYSHIKKTDPEGFSNNIMEPSKNISKLFSLKSSQVIVCLASVILFNVFTVVEGRRCSMFTEFTMFDKDDPNAKETCRTCPKCPVGRGLPIQCGRKVPKGTSTDCIPCPTNTYSITNDATACKPCHECDGKKVLKECTPTQNRECGTTCLDRNYYLDSDNDECKECYFCCEDVPDGERLQQCKDIGMPVNRQCKKTVKNEHCRLDFFKKTTTAPNISEVSNHSPELERPSEPPPPPFYENNDNNNRSTPPSAAEDYKVSYIVGGLLGSICLIAITVMIHKSRSQSQAGNREDVEQDDEHEMSVVVDGGDGAANSSNARRDFEATPTLENDISEGVMLNNFPYYGEDFILKLDITSAGVKNWRHVACKFNVSTFDVQMIEQQGSSNPPSSPTRALIAKLCTQNVSLKRFVEVLQELDRNDVANDILNWCKM